MPLGDLTDAESVREALDEFDAIGRDAFLAKYKFKPARGYFVVQGGKRYDSKAIVGAAYGYQTGTPLLPSDFSGGEATVARAMESSASRLTVPSPSPIGPGTS